MFEKFKYRINKLYNILYIKIENFQLRIFYKNKKNELFNNIIPNNRKFLSGFNYFLSPTEYEKNDYGIQKRIYKDLNKPISNYPTYSDLICLLCKINFSNSLNYLEIGSSVLKNFLQIKNYIENSNLIAYDINEINPDLKDTFYENKNQNTTKYFKGDVLNEEDTKDFKNFIKLKFNIIFSDALHEPEAVYSEYENIYKNLLEDKFIIYFDDLDFPEIKKTVKKIRLDLLKSNETVNFYTFKVYGWIGQYEKMHLNGILTNINLKEALKDFKLYQFKKI